MKTKDITLAEEVVIAGKPTKTVTVRRATVGDEEDAMDMAIQFGRPSNRVTMEMCLLSLISGIPYPTLRGMDGEDYALIRDAHNDLSRPTRPTPGPGGPGTPAKDSQD